MSAHFATFILRFRWMVILATLVVAGVSSWGLQFISISTEPRDNFGADNPQLVAFENLESNFSRVENIFFAIAPDDGKVFTPRVLNIIESLTEEAWRTAYVNRVDSLTNYQHTYAQEDDLIVENLVEFPDQLSLAQLEEKRAIAISEPLVVNRLISADGQVAGMNLDFGFGNADGDHQEQASEWALKKKADIMAAHPDIKVYVSGTVMISAAFSSTAAKDMSTQTPLMYLFVLVLIGLLLRSYAALFGVFVV
ncbi:MAG: MMPL family transporter, partial [Gammaproteobacteria bacterium]|nr:MMPL family transporter [Gammaproteobacteria bacterium]MBT5790403.1 MMPL family transporter [Gammaproteobacteria bacterium]MBT7529496.1 MMPL family transporter [Gammaproteobacteria bacterium]MBT7721781.1 MMPL family transporter [Gammaproteobacteria bacterium]